MEQKHQIKRKNQCFPVNKIIFIHAMMTFLKNIKKLLDGMT